MIDVMLNKMLCNWGFKPEELKAAVARAFSKVDQFDAQLKNNELELKRVNMKLNLLLDGSGLNSMQVDSDISAEILSTPAALIPPTVVYDGKA